MQFVVVSEGVHLGSCSVLKLGVDRNVDLDKVGWVVFMYVGVGLVISLQNNIGVVVDSHPQDSYFGQASEYIQQHSDKLSLSNKKSNRVRTKGLGGYSEGQGTNSPHTTHF